MHAGGMHAPRALVVVQRVAAVDERLVVLRLLVVLLRFRPLLPVGVVVPDLVPGGSLQRVVTLRRTDEDR